MRPLVLAIVVILQGCIFQDLYAMKKGRDARFGTGNKFARGLHVPLSLDADNKSPDDVYFTGHLLADIGATPDATDPKLRLEASVDYGKVKMAFWSADAEKMCFRSVYIEDVGSTSGGTRNYDPKEYIDKLFRSYKFAAEYVGPYDSKPVQERDYVFPKENFSALDQIELVDQKATERRGKQYLINTYMLCGKPLVKPSTPVKFLTVAVQPHNNAEDGEYLLVWLLD